MEEESNLNNDTQGEQRSFLSKVVRRLAKWGTYALGLILFLIILIYFAIQIPTVQKWGIARLESYFFEEFEANLKVGSFRLSFSDMLAIEDVTLYGPLGDSILRVGALNVSFDANMLSVFRGILSVNSVSLKDVDFRYVKGDEGTNIGFLFKPRKNKRKSSSIIELNVKQLLLEDIHFKLEDHVSGFFLDTKLGFGEIRIRDLDFENLIFELHQASLTDLKGTLRLIGINTETETALNPEDIDETAIEAIENALDEIVNGISLEVSKFRLNHASFIYENTKKYPSRQKPINAIDFNFLDIRNLNMDLESFKLAPSLDFDGTLCSMRFETAEGFRVDRFEAVEIVGSNKKLELNKMILETPLSHFSDSILLRFNDLSDFGDFDDKVIMDAKIKKGVLAISDLYYFAPALRKDPFFKGHGTDYIRMSGDVSGRVNNLRGYQIDLSIVDKARFIGSFSARNLTKPDQSMLNLDIQSLSTDIVSLQQLIPGFSLPPNFNKLDRLQFRGRFDGFYSDFVAYGNLNTSLGWARLDLKLNTSAGINQARYSGSLSLTDFDLQKWTGNMDLGKISFDGKVSNGSGLTLETVRANLSADIKSFNFRGYEYSNIVFRGVLNKDKLDGQVTAQDENMQLDFLGTIDFSEKTPAFNFVSSVDHLDLGGLKLIDQPFAISGDFDVNASFASISEIEGFIRVNNMIVSRSDLHYLHIGDIYVDSRYKNVAEKSFSFNSELADLDLRGEFDIQTIWPDLKRTFRARHPDFAEVFGIEEDTVTITDNQFRFDFIFKDSKNLFDVLDIPIDSLNDLRLRGQLSNKKGGSFSYSISELHIPRLQWKDLLVEGFFLSGSGRNDSTSAIVHIDKVKYGQVDIEPFDGLFELLGDTIYFNAGSESVLNSFERVNINGKYFLVEGRSHFGFDIFEFNALDTHWQITEKNFIQVAKDFLYARNIRFSNGRGYVGVSTYNSRGAHIQANDIDISFLNPMLSEKDIRISGLARADFFIDDFVKMQQIKGDARLSNFYFNDIQLGTLKLFASLDDMKSPLYLDLDARYESNQATASGFIYMPGVEISSSMDRYAFEGRFDRYSISITDYFLKGIFSNTEGVLSGTFNLSGRDKLDDFNADLVLNDVSTKLDYLGTRYAFDQTQVKITNNNIDFGEFALTDQMSNRANVRGGIRHNLFRDFDLNFRITSPQFLVLNTKKTDNELFYGRAQGKIDVRMTGSFENLDINVIAETGPQTVVAIPLNTAIEAKEQNFIIFKSKDDDAEVAEKSTNLEGLSLQMQFTITPAAELQLIFDERTGDVIKGSGNGNIQIELPRDGKFQMYGDFEIEKGEYPFKAFVVLDKAFAIRRGGTITWYGDPLNAYIDLQAEYKGLRTSPYNFIFDYIRNDPKLLAEAKRPTDVDLLLNLKGQLLQPAIQFDLAFPTLQGELRNYTDNRLRTLSANPDELNMTAISLLAFKGFLPQSTDLLSTSTFSNTLGSTLTEWVTNQMRVFVNEYLIDSLGKNSIVSNVDLDFGLVLNPAINNKDLQDLAGRGQSQFYIKPRMQLFDDRVTVDLGLNTFGDISTEAGQFGLEFNAEYSIGQSRRLRARVYSQQQPLITNRRIVSGAGIAYRREYYRLGDIFRFSSQSRQKGSSETKDPESPEPIPFPVLPPENDGVEDEKVLR